MIVYSWVQMPLAVITSLNVIVGVPSQLSVAVAEPPVDPGAVLEVHEMVTFDGHVIDGAALSSTAMIWLHVLVLLQSSVARQVRVIVYSCMQMPLAVVTSVNVMVGVASQLSVAVAEPPVAPGAVLEVHDTVTFAGH